MSNDETPTTPAPAAEELRDIARALDRLSAAVEEQDTRKIAAEIAGAKAALGRLGTATLKVHYQQQRTHRVVEQISSTAERLERRVGDNSEKLAVVLKKVDDTEDAVDDLHEDLTPPMGTPLATPEDVKDPRIGIGPVSMPQSHWKRIMPFVFAAVLGAAVLALLIVIAFVWSSAHGR